MWANPQETADLVTFTEEILNGKLRFFCGDNLTTAKSKRKQNKTLYDSGSYLFIVIWKEKIIVSKLHVNNYSYCEMSGSFFSSAGLI